MVTLKNWKIFFVLLKIALGISASTHWIVTENGRIESHLDSQFHLRRPYDLLGLLDQEDRLIKKNTLYQDLVSRQSFMSKWSGFEDAIDLESRIYSQDSDCLKARKLSSEIDLYISIAADGSDRDGIQLSDFLIQNGIPENDDETVIPDCQRAVSLEFSMFAFEHLSAMVNRANLSILPEQALEQWLQSGTTVSSFGHQVALGLNRNATSWLHHNLGVIYWRIKGEALKAIECGRRAVHFAPREYRDIALLNLASIFHQAQFPAEAAIILHAAVDHAPHQPANHFALGNVYAILADYNRSIACYDNFLKLRPALSEVLATKHTILCHRKLEMELVDMHESLQEILTEIHNFHNQQEQFIRLHERIKWEQAPIADKSTQTPETLNAMLLNRGQSCTQKESEDGKPSHLSCDLKNDNLMLAHNLQLELILTTQMFLRNVEMQVQMVSEHLRKSKDYVNRLPVSRRKNNNKEDTLVKSKFFSDLNSLNLNSDELYVPATQQPKYSPQMDIPKTGASFDSPGWPTKQQCLQWKLYSDFGKDTVLSIYLPPENKGFEVHKMLSDLIGLSAGSEHALPWYPPICPSTKSDEKPLDTTYFPASVIRAAANPQQSSDTYLQSLLINYVNQGKVTEAEIGQRIITAIQKKAGPGWLLATLASLYWRVRTNPRNSIDCLNIALQSVPNEHRDVVLVSIGSLLYELGFIEDALKVTLEAFSVNNIEPATNFLLALLYSVKDNPVIASYHLKQTLRLDSHFYQGQADLLLRTWACRSRLHFIEGGGVKQEPREGMCAEKDAVSTEGVFCSAGGEQCKAAAIQCYRAETITDESQIQSLSKLLASDHCNQRKLGLGHSLISTLLAANGEGISGLEGSGNVEPDQSQLESMSEGQQQAFHMRISLGDENTPVTVSTLGDFYVSVSLTDDPTEAMLYVYDKSGTYPLSPKGCRAIRDADWLQFSSMWQSIATRNMDIGPFLKPLLPTQEPLKPHCDISLPPSPTTLDHLTAMRLRYHRLIPNPEPTLAEWLGLMAGDQHSTLRDLGTRIAIALQENNTSWILATAAALYWRTVGYTDEAVTCLRQALTYAPADVRDIPLINLANILQRVGFHSDALEVAYMALDTRPNFVVNHFTVGNIHTALGDLEKAISFYRSSLALDANFEPARNRLQAILCTLLFDESGTLRDSTDISDN